MPSSRPVACPDLYCITDPDLSPHPVEEQVRQMIEGGARIVQLRDKHAVDSNFGLTAQKCLSICHWAEALFIVNDRVEIAAAVGADGVHLGQHDMRPEQARRIIGDEAVVGISTHNPDQFLRAIDEPVDYIALGPIFTTRTKKNPDPVVALDFVREAAELLEDDYRPLVLIGGITFEKLPLLRAAAPKAFVAVIGDILRAPSIGDRVRDFREAIFRPVT